MTGLSWFSITRLGLVQAALGAIVMLVTSLLNRVMVVEYALPAAIPAALVGFHYAIQLSRPRFGHGSDGGARRTPWIIGGMGMLSIGGLMATNATLMAADRPLTALVLAILAYALIGAGVGASGTNLLALIASRTAEARRPAAAALTWILMIAGIVVTAGVAGSLLDPFSPQRLATVAGGVVAVAFLVTLLAVAGVEARAAPVDSGTPHAQVPFRAAMAETWAEPAARRFSVFVFTAMLAYSMQDMVLEPFAGLAFGYTPGESTSLSSLQHMGVLAGMLLVGVGGSAFSASRASSGGGGAMRIWVTMGCIGSALALLLLAAGALIGPGFPLKPAVMLLGFCNGVFAVSAIGAMMSLAGAPGPGREGVRMGLWGAAQAIAFGLGGFIGAVGVDVGRSLMGSDGPAFFLVFSAEALLFLAAAAIALTLGRSPTTGPARPDPQSPPLPSSLKEAHA
jgi:BCD family chlorophyll transporter-like MFS transporter